MASRQYPVQRPPAADPTTRASSKLIRRTFTDALKAKGVASPDYGAITKSTYICLWGTNAAGLRRAWGLARKANVREHMSALQLAATIMTEAMTVNRLTSGLHDGGEACRLAAIACAGRVRRMLEGEPAGNAEQSCVANDTAQDDVAA